jgi:hypothetical protein
LRIDENDHRTAKFCGQLRGSQSFAVAFRLCLAKISREPLLGIASLLASDDHHRLALKPCHSGDDGGIVGEMAVAMNLAEIFKK